MLAKIRKAIVAGLAAGLTALVSAAVQHGSVTLGATQLSVALVAMIGAGVATFYVPNSGPTPPAGVTGTYVGK